MKNPERLLKSKEYPKDTMINTKDQEDMFKLIASYLERDIEVYAIGGTAMMFFGYKTTTKDIDLVFDSKKDMGEFVRVLNELGYSEKSMKGIYDKKRRDFKSKPKMFSRGEERFDLFLKSVFGFEFTERLKENIKQRRDFIDKKELIINILPKEYTILLKLVTNREKDFEDIKDIIEKDKDIDWDVLVKEAIEQRKNNGWILLDLEEKMKDLKKITLIKSKYFEKIYRAEDEYHK